MEILVNFFEAGYRMLVIWLAVALHQVPGAVAPGLGQGYWHTQGNQILDARNHPVRITGINWYGFETPRGIPGGLDVQDYRVILKAAQQNGYNTLRLPISNEMLEHPSVPQAIRFANQGGSINTDLKGLTSVQILDKIIQYAGTLGLKVILDDHRSEAGDGPEMSGLWYTQAYPEGAWIADWQMLAKRYQGNPTVIGFDIRNEPHNANSGGACWSCGGGNDWHLAAERAGNAILAVNPHLLIFVEGVDVYENDYYWWGGNLEGVRSAPVELNVPNQLVYSAHDYGPVESGQPWFTPGMTDDSLRRVWQQHWGYISEEGLAPVWIGEFGVDVTLSDVPTPTETMEAAWFKSMVQYLADNPRLSWSYWTLNGGDHNGLLSANYNTTPRDAGRQEALASIQFPLAINTSSQQAAPRESAAAAATPEDTRPAPESRAEMTVIPVVHAEAASALSCHVSYSNLKDWRTGYTAALTIHNTGQQPINGWRLSWRFTGSQKITQLWDGNYAQDDHTVTVTNLSFNAQIPAGGEQTGIGFNADYHGDNPAPVEFFLNDVPCQ
ncbi:MAG: cellulase family glycosylhydrolase [Acidobacteriota bacterium]|nr:cellulase family glycosylhydrolase [Acidobacteriota bacterium]